MKTVSKQQRAKPCDVVLVGYEEDENIGLRSIAAYLQTNGAAVNVLGYQPGLKENLTEAIKALNPVIVGFSLIFQRMLTDFADLISYLRQEGVSAHFTMGGHFPTLAYNTTLELMPGLDSVIRHEGEITLLNLLRSIHDPGSWDKIDGLVYREKGNGKLNVNAPRHLIKDLDSLPFPLRRTDAPAYRGIGMRSLIASRGCYYNCSFCSVQEFYRGAPGCNRRTRSPGHVADEMELLFKEQGTRVFIFKDDDLATGSNENREWIQAFIQELKRRKLGDEILWRISCRVDQVDADIIRQLKDVGLLCIYLGIESGNQQGLDTFKKHYRVKKIFHALDILEQAQVNFEYGFMMFDPDSTFASIQENLAFLETLAKHDLVAINFTKMFPYVGTSIVARLEKEGRLRGTTSTPDYVYDDKRLELLELFFTRTFSHRNFDAGGLANLIQLAKFDLFILTRFFPDRYDLDAYKTKLLAYINRCNDSILETMSTALRFMEALSYHDIVANWGFLGNLSQQEMHLQYGLETALKQLIREYEA